MEICSITLGENNMKTEKTVTERLEQRISELAGNSKNPTTAYLGKKETRQFTKEWTVHERGKKAKKFTPSKLHGKDGVVNIVHTGHNSYFRVF